MNGDLEVGAGLCAGPASEHAGPVHAHLGGRVRARIQRLTPSLANHIAAGEVVERPASVLKELLENSLDAGSTHIDVHIEGGGIGLIRVQDNGIGICKDDLILALAPHATSKIHQLSDLDGIGSYGFRGEALASIGAVSQLRLSSWVSDQAQGWTVSLEGRAAEAVITPAPTQVGTCIEVRHLFYNTPARRRFLRSEKTEGLYLEEVFKRVVLSQPTLSFSFTQNQGVRKRYPAALTPEAFKRRVALIGGQRFIQEAAFLESEVHGFQLQGYIGSCAVMRAQADLQYFYVNRRIVRDKIINHAIRQAYGDRIPQGRHPAYVLYFDLDLKAVDVNVHPTKHEVRFRDARSVHDFLVYALEEGLKKAEQPGLATTNVGAGLCAGPALTYANPVGASCVDVGADLCVAPALTYAGTIVFLEKNLLFTKMPNQGNHLMMVNLKKSKTHWVQRTLCENYETNTIQKRALLWPQSFKMQNPEILTTSIIDWERLGFDVSPIGIDQILLRSLPDCVANAMNTQDKDANNLRLSEDPVFAAFIAALFHASTLNDAAKHIAEHCAQTPFVSIEAAMAFFEELQQSSWFIRENVGLECYKVIDVEGLSTIR